MLPKNLNKVLKESEDSISKIASAQHQEFMQMLRELPSQQIIELYEKYLGDSALSTGTSKYDGYTTEELARMYKDAIEKS